MYIRRVTAMARNVTVLQFNVYKQRDREFSKSSALKSSGTFRGRTVSFARRLSFCADRHRQRGFSNSDPPICSEPLRSLTKMLSARVHDDLSQRNDGVCVASAASPPLSDIVLAFEDVENLLKSEEPLDLETFCRSCSSVPVLFSCLGLAFKFAESEFVAKLRDLEEASKKFRTVGSMLDHDILNNTVRTQGSHSRNLRRIRLGIDLMRALFQQFVSSNDSSIREVASTAYTQVCAPFHTWAVRTAVSAGMYTLPSRDQLLLRLNETEYTAKKKMKRYIEAVVPIVKYIDKLYTSRNIPLNW